MPKSLSQFTITGSEDGYILQLEDEDGDMIELVATDEQLDLIADALEEQRALDDIDDIDEDSDA